MIFIFVMGCIEWCWNRDIFLVININIKICCDVGGCGGVCILLGLM